ncbi:MAG: cell division protein FtsQ/DivIB [Bacteroidota bacterium]
MKKLLPHIRLPLSKIKYISLWLGILLYLVFSLSFTEEKRKNTICSEIRVQVVDSLSDRFVTDDNIKDFVHDLDMKILGEPFKNVNIRELERYLNARDDVREAEAYFTADGTLYLQIDQRNPVVRVINNGGQSFYIDDEGVIMPLSESYSSHVLIASGEINEFSEVVAKDRLNCPGANGDEPDHQMCEIYELATFIHGDSFWKSQIEQIYLNHEGWYELIPRVGGHLILFGEFEDYREKFRNLKAFYKKGLNNVGWNQYMKINLKYDNQIICTKR